MSEARLQLYGAQHDFVFTDRHYAALCGGIGSGKSFAGAVRALLAAMGRVGDADIPTPNLGIVTAATYPMLRDATFRVFRELAADYITDINRTEFRVTLVNGSEVLFRSATDPDGLRGPNAAWWWGDEAALYDGLVWRIMIGRLRQHGLQGFAWLTTTPKGRNWLYREFVESSDVDYAIWRTSTRANPFLNESFVAGLEAAYSGDFARQELEGDFVAHEGLIYLEFRRERHTFTERPGQFAYTVAGVDWGYANPGVILVFGVDSDARMWLIHEEYQRSRRVEDWAQLGKQLQDTYDIQTFYCDPAEPEYISMFASAGCHAEQAKNDVMPGIQVVKNRLAVQGDGKPRLMVHVDAANTLSEFEQYQWLENRDGLRDQPRKTNDHAMDALRYAAMGVDEGWVSGYGAYYEGTNPRAIAGRY
jgi:PBSX family phage terminase large subunit